jgi:beta-galactosidase
MFTKKMLYGAAYYPEHWERKLWARDVKLMHEAGFNVVRMGEFAWWFFEPSEGVFKFDWLDDALDLLGKAGIRAVIGTPTATIPAWLCKGYPHVMGIYDGVSRRPFGIRKDYCVLQPEFERLAFRVIEQIARHYAGDERVIGFQTDNEFGSSRCRCELCLEYFRRFLRKRYGTIDKLNKEYGAWFWGAVYNHFDEIDWPATDYPNPGHGLDLKRFANWVDTQHQHKQIHLLRQFAPKKLITHNCMPTHPGLEYFEFTKDLDFVAWDSYPGNNTADHFGHDAMAAALAWSWKQANYLVMEQQSGPGGWTAYSPQTAPGETAMLAWQAVARGADGISYFRWRTSVSGQEQYWHGIINHDNVPRRRYYEIAEMGKQVARLSDKIIGTTPARQVGIHTDAAQHWATDHQIQNGPDPIRFNTVMAELAQAIAPLAVDFGMFGADSDLKAFKLLLCPPLYLTDPKFAARLAAYVRAGGGVVFTARSGVKTVNNKNLMEPLPGAFGKLAGMEVDEYCVVNKSDEWFVELPGGQRVRAARMREHLLAKKGTEVVGVHRGGYMDGWPAITRRKVGKGAVWYVGTLPSPADWRAILLPILAEAKVDFRTDLPEGVEVARRVGKGKDLTFVINHTALKQTVAVARPTVDLLTGKKVADRVELAPFATAILQGK